jgi:DNA repair exonuclease SbcCD ATPase subunit
VETVVREMSFSDVSFDGDTALDSLVSALEEARDLNKKRLNKKKVARRGQQAMAAHIAALEGLFATYRREAEQMAEEDQARIAELEKELEKARGLINHNADRADERQARIADLEAAEERLIADNRRAESRIARYREALERLLEPGAWYMVQDALDIARRALQPKEGE